MMPMALLASLSLVFLVLQQMAPRIGRHELTFLGFSIAFLALLLNGPEIAWLGAFLVLNYGWLIVSARQYRLLSPVVLILPVVLTFAVFKKYELLPFQPLYAHIPDLLGLSYIIFRVIMMQVEARGKGTLPRIVPYLTFCLSMFTFLSGPVQGYRAFNEDMERRRTFILDAEGAALALTRFMNGVIKLIYFAPCAQNVQGYFMWAQQNVSVVVIRMEMALTLHSPLEFLGALGPPVGFGLAALCYLVFLYFNFSGYTDMMIGLGRLLGFHLPENFDRPFAATSFLDFWKRWHISLSLWFRDYCFTPVLKRMVKAGIKDPVLAALPAYFISFGLLGLWHGRTWPFILCGLMFAAGSVANHFYRSLLNQRVETTALERLDGNRLYRVFATSLTLFYISLAITGLWLPDATFTTVWHSFSVLQGAGAFTLIVFCLTCILYLGWGPWHAKRIQEMVIRPVRYFFDSEASSIIAAKIFLAIIWVYLFSANIPDFVYQRF